MNDLSDLYKHYLSITSDRIAAAILVLAEQQPKPQTNEFVKITELTVDDYGSNE